MVALSDILARRTEILQVAARHGARNVRVFGSVVRGEARAGSDLDLLVHMDEDRSLLDRIALMHELGDLLGCRVEVVNDRCLHRLLRDRVHAEEVPL